MDNLIDQIIKEYMKLKINQSLDKKETKVALKEVKDVLKYIEDIEHVVLSFSNLIESENKAHRYVASLEPSTEPDELLKLKDRKISEYNDKYELIKDFVSFNVINSRDK